MVSMDKYQIYSIYFILHQVVSISIIINIFNIQNTPNNNKTLSKIMLPLFIQKVTIHKIDLCAQNLKYLHESQKSTTAHLTASKVCNTSALEY